MQLGVKTKKVGEMTLLELKNLIRDTLFEVIDPDYGLELRIDVEKELRESRMLLKNPPFTLRQAQGERKTGWNDC